MDERVHHLAARFPQVKVHLYGKAFRPGRKLGHVNVLGSDLGELRRVAGWPRPGSARACGPTGGTPTPRTRGRAGRRRWCSDDR